MNLIEIKGLTKYYGKARGIIDVSFNVEEGEIFGFIGSNGAGKSTTIRTLLKLIHPTSGETKIFGMDCIEDSSTILKEIGYLPAEVFYYEDMKVIDLLNYSASFYQKDCSKRIKELSKIMELDLNKRFNELSHGNKKKVGIVQALLHEPKLLILDEPTTGLDPLMQQKFFNFLKEENKKGVTIFFSSHVLSEVQKICDRVGIIKEGRLIRIEKMNEINQDNYKRFKIEVGERIKKDYFKVDNVSDLKVDGNIHSFIFKGDVNEILNKITRIKIKNITINDPDLEEIFLHYYNNSEEN